MPKCFVQIVDHLSMENSAATVESDKLTVDHWHSSTACLVGHVLDQHPQPVCQLVTAFSFNWAGKCER